jgi:enediyne biosynthesis thioesterase
MTRAFEYEHVVTFDETNLVGNVYFVNHLRWQGHCRELFLQERAPGLVAELADGLVLVTTRCSCEYFAELSVFDRVVVQMRLEELGQNLVTMRFDYLRAAGGGEEIVARGEQQIACFRRRADGLEAVPVPEELREALLPYEEHAAAVAVP